jgi:hypothetical protein
MPKELKEYLPEKVDADRIRELYASGNFSMQQAHSVVLGEHREKIKEGLHMALGDYFMGPVDAGGEVFLAEILVEMIDLIR